MIKGKFCIRTLIKGSYFGELEVLTNSPRIFSIKAQSSCQLIKIKGDHFLQIMKNYPAINLDILKRALAGYIKTSQAITVMNRFTKLHAVDSYWLDQSDDAFDGYDADSYHIVINQWLKEYIEKNDIESMDLE